MSYGLYRLELRWSGITKHDSENVLLSDAYFSGPALKLAEKIRSPNFMTIDLTPQYYKLILGSYYFVYLYWSDVEYKDDIVVLKQARLRSSEEQLQRIVSSDYIVIDTEDHEDDKHMYNLVYKGKVVDKEGREYEDE